jgi:peptidoglycan/LPS O-acetylase OafA/YrhL
MANSKFGVFRSLQLGRFAAASAVVLYHIYLDSPNRSFFGTTFDFGFLGVDFFFVLSGFIILYIHWDDIGQTQRIGSFALKRFTRLYPTYFILLSFAVALLLLMPHYGLPQFHNPSFILTNYALLPTNGDPILGLSWTLQHELAFYMLFAILIGWPTLGSTLLAVWFVASFYSSPDLPYPLSWLCDQRHVEFLFGMAGAYLVKTTTIPKPAAVTCLGIAMLVATALVCDVDVKAGASTVASRFPLYLPAGFASALIIVGAVQAEIDGLRLPTLATALGDISYALYLSQEFVLEAFYKAGLKLNIWRYVPPELYGLATYVAAVVAAACFYYYVEKPLLTLLRGSKQRQRRIVQHVGS